MVCRSLGLHTGHMAGHARATTFVTGASGFIGTELVRVLVARPFLAHDIQADAVFSNIRLRGIGFH